MGGDKQNRPNWARFSGIGFEFGAAVIGFTLVGYWIDRHYDSTPIGTLIGSGLGIIGGGYNLIRASLIATREASKKDRADRSDNDKLD